MRHYPLMHMLYIVRFLHQTTTVRFVVSVMSGCISSVSYIKPQPFCAFCVFCCCCISSVSYIKPQLKKMFVLCYPVVYRPFPTSNHNHRKHARNTDIVVYRPFPTSNHNLSQDLFNLYLLYIVRFLHQTTTSVCTLSTCALLYIVRFLHQTTTRCVIIRMQN